ncbi:MAG TPA: hypothetical protein VE572_01520 [Nitrososphaeraceae archaeon]|nr:hypothetical protein [Nitrososphaeraceae archaeon]
MVLVGIITIGITLGGPSLLMMFQYQAVVAFKAEDGQRITTVTKAPVVISGDNIYVVWWTNKTANGDGEVMFRASNDGGATFGDKINLSNNTVTNSVDAEIAAEGANVIVTWWERNSTSNEPVAKISTDGGQTFGPVLMLAANGTIGSTGEEGEAE